MTAIDLRSDTVTRPSPGMRRAMAEAEVGDDMLDGDPTTRRLEQRVAEILGMSDALFFPSGTQANETGVALVTSPGTEIILEADSHLVHYEMAAVAALWGVQIRPVTTTDGLLSGALVRGAFRFASPFLPRVSAVAVENTHNAAGGRVLPPDRMRDIVAAAAERHLPVHLDGARLWNAAAALEVPLATLTAGTATVMVTFSKGLGCPVGSCLAFAGDRRAEAWEIRKRLGGGMRQSGILSAAALYALDHHLAGLVDDHRHARLLADRLADCPGARALPPETNIVMIDLLRDGETAERVLPRLAAAGVLVVQIGRTRLRAVLHRDIGREDVERAAAIIRKTLA